MPRVPSSTPSSSGTPGGRSLPGASSTRRGTNLAREQLPTRGQNQAQDDVRRRTAAANALPFGDGNLITGVKMVSGVPQQIAHKLGAPWRGYMPMNVQGGIAAFNAIPAPATDGATITLTATGNCTLDLWVYK